MSFRSLAFALAAVAAGPAFAAPSTVKVTEVWCRAAPTGAQAGACYATLTAIADDHLVAVETPAAARGEIHTMSLDGGVMRMRKLADGLALPAGKAVTLKPGAEHFMIIGPKQPLAAGRTIPLTLRFAKARPLTLQVPVKTAPAPSMPHTDHH